MAATPEQAPGARRRRIAGTTAAHAAATAVLVALTASLGAAQDRGFEGRRPDEEVGRNGIFSLPRSQDDIAKWLRAIEDIGEDRYADAAQRLHDLLDNSRGSGLVPTASPDRFLGLRAAVVRTLRDLPERGLEAYEALAEREVGYLLRRDPLTLDAEELATIANRFPAADAGLRAALRLADLALERGDGVGAEVWLRAAADALPSDDRRQGLLAQRWTVARLLILGRRTIARGDEITELERTVAGSVAAHELRGWPSYGGGYDATRWMTPPTGDLHDTRRFAVHAPGFQGNPMPMHAVGDLARIFVSNGLRVTAIDPLRGEIAWESRAPIEGGFPFEEVEDSINPTMALAPAVGDDLVVASLQVADEVVGSNQNRRFRTISVINKIPVRRLFAFNRVTGKQVWSHWDERGGEIANRFRGHNVAACPVVHGDTVYVASHDQTGAIEYYLSAYDLYTGEPKWRRLICSSQQEVNMFGNAEQEFAAAPLSVCGGVVYGSTNLGVCFAADAEDGSVRWISAYDVIELPPARLHKSDVRDWYFQNNPPVLLDGVVAFTPVDSRDVLAFDADDGRLLWQLPHDPGRGLRVRWLLGAIDDEFVFSGLGVLGVRADQKPQRGFEADYRVIADPVSVGQDDIYAAASVGRGAIAAGTIWQAGPRGLLAIDPNGRVTPAGRRARAQDIARQANLLLVDGIAVTVDDHETRVHADPVGLRLEAERRVSESPSDPAALLQLAALDDMQIGDDVEGVVADRAEALYRRALGAARARGLGPGHPVFDEIADARFELGMARASRVATRDAERGLRMLRQIRDEAPRPASWIEAQRAILSLVADDEQRYLAEIDSLAARHGPVEHVFERGQAPVPVAAWALWRSAETTRDPRTAVLRLQELLERFGDVTISGRPARALVFGRMRELIDEHGRDPYAPIEARAGALLSEARREAPESLREVVRRFPHSQAARRATAILLDAAALEGDLFGAARFFAESLGQGGPPPGVLRRLLAAAEARGNRALVAALAARLASDDYRDRASDFPPDAEASYGEIVEPLLEAEIDAGARPNLREPRTIVSTISPPGEGKVLLHVPTTVGLGFDTPPDLPIYATLEDFYLLAFDPSVEEQSTAEPLFRTRIAGNRTCSTFLADTTLIVFDGTSIRGLGYRDGSESWRYDADEERMLLPIGLRAGVLCVFSQHVRRGDGGTVVAIEPVSGAVLWRRVLDPSRVSAAPILSTPTAETGPDLPTIWVLDGTRLTGIDVLTAATTSEFELAGAQRAFLGMNGPTASQSFVGQIQRFLRADANSIYLSRHSAGRTGSPSVLALDHDGDERWHWLGHPGRALDLVEPDGRGGVVIVERSTAERGTSRLVQLTANGIVRREPGLGRGATVRNKPELPGDPLPASLLIADQTRGHVPRIVCENLDGSMPSFEKTFPGTGFIGTSPHLGDDFLAVLTGRRGGVNELHVVDLKMRDSLLPGGPLELFRGASCLLQRQGRHLVAQTPTGLRILGNPAK